MSQLTGPQAAALREQLQVLRETYGARLGEKVEEIIALWRAFLANPEKAAPAEDLTVLFRLTHTVAGSAATFGFPEAGAAARRAEGVFKGLVESKGSLGVVQEAEIELALSELRALAKAAALPKNDPQTTESQLRQAEEQSQPETSRRTVYVYSEAGLPDWTETLRECGYGVDLIESPAALRDAVRKHSPCAIICNCREKPMAISRDNLPLSTTLAEIHREAESPLPVLWTCRTGDMETRLEAVRLGGAAFFTDPVDVDALVAKLDDLTAHRAPEPFRVLIVDDEGSLGRLFSLILKQAGMQTQVVTDPLQIMGPLVDFRPDLILMDVYMPACSGIELAAVIRQQEAYVGIPIVFLSVETDIGRQAAAMREGGDDFLIKPIQPKALVSAVTTRAMRSRVLRHLTARDSLTGLLTHLKSREQLEIELNRARRLGHPLAIALLDLDEFKAVNEAHGHATGDRVLRSLGRLLSQRMRQTDVVGRYGGEKFILILSGSDHDSALRVVDALRKDFGQRRHASDGREFQVAFSAGIATAPPHTDANSLCEAAERALAEAKRRGRNRVELSDEKALWALRGPMG